MAVIDIRETLLVRLQEVMGSIDGAPVPRVYRNRSGLPKELRPCGLLLDGIERRVGSVQRRSGRGGDVAVMLMGLRPGIFFAHHKRKIEEHELVGPEMSASRMAVLDAIMNDDDLVALCGTNGGIDYEGFDTDMQNHVIQDGVTEYFFQFRYPLDPDHLR